MQPTPSPNSNPTSNMFKVVCASPNGCGNNPVLNAETSEIHKVRCCSDTAKSGWINKSHCDVWAESDLGSPAQCNTGTYTEARAICLSANARLCTEEELAKGCTRGSGCGYDNKLIWSATPVPRCTDDASCNDGLECTVNTCGSDGICTTEWEPGCGKLVACGSTEDKCLPTPMVKPADLGEKHEVRCCSDTSITGWVLKNSCKNALGRDVWGASRISGQCHSAKTYAEAEAICLGASARLCTSDEVRADCARRSGCSFDQKHVWTSTDASLAAVVITKESRSGDVTTTKVTTQGDDGETTQLPPKPASAPFPTSFPESARK